MHYWIINCERGGIQYEYLLERGRRNSIGTFSLFFSSDEKETKIYPDSRKFYNASYTYSNVRALWKMYTSICRVEATPNFAIFVQGILKNRSLGNEEARSAELLSNSIRFESLFSTVSAFLAELSRP